jgi:hypothetical protein
MGAGDGHDECIAAANWLTAIELEDARGIQNRHLHLGSNGDPD